MPKIIEELKPIYGKCYLYADKMLALARPLPKNPDWTPREQRIYNHIMQAYKSLWEAIEECVVPTDEEQEQQVGNGWP